MKYFQKLNRQFATGVAALGMAAGLAFGAQSTLAAEKYVIDTEGMHAFVQFRTKHVGFSWLYGRFNDFSGEFTYDEENPESNSAKVTVDITSLDSNHAERDKHLRSSDFLHADKWSTATFESTGYKSTGENTGVLTGDLTLFGETNEIEIDVTQIGSGQFRESFRRGFEGRATINPADWGRDFTKKLGPPAAEVELMLSVEGVRQ